MPKNRAGNSPSPRRRGRWTANEATKVLEAQAESGLTLSAFARREGLNAYRLYRWRRRLWASAPESPMFEEIVASQGGPPRADPGPPAPDRLEVVLRSGLVVRVSEFFNAEALRRLLDVVEGGRSC